MCKTKNGKTKTFTIFAIVGTNLKFQVKIPKLVQHVHNKEIRNYCTGKCRLVDTSIHVRPKKNLTFEVWNGKKFLVVLANIWGWFFEGKPNAEFFAPFFLAFFALFFFNLLSCIFVFIGTRSTTWPHLTLKLNNRQGLKMHPNQTCLSTPPKAFFKSDFSI